MADWIVQFYWKERRKYEFRKSTHVQLCSTCITNSICIRLTPFPAELFPLNKVSMGSMAASTSTPMMVTFTPPLHIGEIRVSNVSTIF